MVLASLVKKSQNETLLKERKFCEKKSEKSFRKFRGDEK